MGASFGGSSQTVFGTEGPMPLLNKVTTGSAILFMVTSVTLAYFSAHSSTSSVMSDVLTAKPITSVLQRAPETIPQEDVQLGTQPGVSKETLMEMATTETMDNPAADNTQAPETAVDINKQLSGENRTPAK